MIGTLRGAKAVSVAQADDRDRLAEMRASLIHMFGQTLRSFELAHAASPTHSHNLSWAHVPSNSYSLTVVVHITDQELATRNFKMDWINEVAIGPYEPNFSSEVDIAKKAPGLRKLRAG